MKAGLLQCEATEEQRLGMLAILDAARRARASKGINARFVFVSAQMNTLLERPVLVGGLVVLVDHGLSGLSCACRK